MRGSIKRIGENRWRLTYDLTRENSKRRQKRVTFEGTKREAERELAKRIEDVRGGYRGTNDSLSQFLRGWIESRTVSGNTKKSLENALKYIEPRIGEIRLDEITPSILQKLYGELLKRGAIKAKQPRGLKASSVERVHAFLRTALGDAHRMGLLPFNPADRVRAPKAEARIPRVLTAVEVRAILAKLAGTEWYLLVLLASITGLRLGELLALQRSDFTGERLVINRSVDPTGKVKAPKNGRPRLIPLTPQLQALIEEHLPQAEWVFPGELRENSANTSARFGKLMEKAGFSGVHVHTFRHTVGSLLMTKGIHPKAIQQILGHHDVAYTMKVYSHLMPGAFEEATTPLGDLVRDRSVTASGVIIEKNVTK